MIKLSSFTLAHSAQIHDVAVQHWNDYFIVKELSCWLLDNGMLKVTDLQTGKTSYIGAHMVDYCTEKDMASVVPVAASTISAPPPRLPDAKPETDENGNTQIFRKRSRK
jgi:hypothetical protein